MKKKQNNMKKTDKPVWIRIFHWTVIVAVVAVALAGLFAAGSPQQERARRLDVQRVNDLEQISYAIDQYYKTNGVLPDSLETLQSSRNIYVGSITDSETGTMYEYLIEDADRYSLCAVFTTVSETDKPFDRSRGSAFWSHGIGYTCFELDIVADPGAPAPIRVIQ
jgi:type II secretory pathway pseudopilin PulG